MATTAMGEVRASEDNASNEVKRMAEKEENAMQAAAAEGQPRFEGNLTMAKVSRARPCHPRPSPSHSPTPSFTHPLIQSASAYRPFILSTPFPFRTYQARKTQPSIRPSLTRQGTETRREWLLF